MVYTNVGKTAVRDWLAGSAPDYPLTMAIGSGTASAAVSQTALGTELTRGTFDSVATSSDYIVSYDYVLNSVELTGNDLSEVGLFNSTASTAGTMFTRNTFSTIEKTDQIEIQFTEYLEVE